MTGSQRLTLVVAAALAIMAALGFASGHGGFGASMRLNTDTAAVYAPAALFGFVAARMGRRAADLYLVAVGLLLVADAFAGATRGIFYLSFESLRGTVTPMTKPARYIAVLPHAILGIVALVAGLRSANAAAAQRRDLPPS
ncbi:MAG: hypothetical protein KDJ20_01270 [Hyphomicrobiales bacterium]|nr:hypothetical protein [Rhodoblastus sp.]MCB9997382.1 hypothetical protein [Methylobacteriaceae bacterium]MCC2101533.1 hypothetical protein [Hyphomicrobiales bacterium]HRY02993.1 hypothetical protein [Beijerinckiaceae bacterium]MCB1524544.1 hypothetical protein [Rhodoblastus sp.]